MITAYPFTKAVSAIKLENEIKASAIATQLDSIILNGTNELSVRFVNALSAGDEGILNSLVTAHVAVTSVESLTLYLDGVIFPFIKNLINEFAATNISQGITQAGKAGDVLGLFEKQYTVSGISKPVSLKASFDTGSLYVSRAIIQHVRDNATEYDGLSPFVSDAKLLLMKNKIETQLGIALST